MAKAKRKATSRARPVKLRAAALATAAPVLGSPSLGQTHALVADSLVTASPEFKLGAKTHYFFETADSSRPRKGRPRNFTDAEVRRLKAWLADRLSKYPRLPSEKASARAVKKEAGKSSTLVIERQIVRPVYKALRSYGPK